MTDLKEVRDLKKTCSARSKTTQSRCQKSPEPGSTVCRIHGGAAPQVIAAARRRILEAADPVAAELIKIALSGESESARVQAAKDLLDRAGLKPKTEVELTTPDSDLDRSIADLLTRMKTLDPAD